MPLAPAFLERDNPMTNIPKRVASAAGALLAVAAVPHAASAQAVRGGMRSGAQSQTQSAPASQPAPESRPEPVYQQPQPVYQQPSRVYQQPRPVYQPNPVMRSGPVFSTPEAPARNRYSPGGGGYRQRLNDPLPTYSPPSAYGPSPVAPARTYSNDNYTPRRRGLGIPPIGAGNGYFNSGIPPIGPGNGFGSPPDSRPRYPVQIGTFGGPQSVPQSAYGNNYLYTYSGNPSPAYAYAPPLLGGYYYGNYCDTYAPQYTYPSLYTAYFGFPRYIFNPSIVVIGQPYYPVYVTSYLPFYTPTYPVTYNETNYYVTSESRVSDFEAGGDRAREAIRNAYPADSYQATFGDIARTWTSGDVKPLRRHVRGSDTRLSVFLNRKYSYSIASGDFVQITRDALDRLQTTSFTFTRLRKAKNGDVTAYGTHVYRTSGDAGAAVGTPRTDGGDADGGTVPFDNGADGTDSNSDAAPYDRSGDPAGGEQKTVYVSYTLRRTDGKWYIVAVDSSASPLVSGE